ncbi:MULTISPECIES: hypothetical protein [unclassified Janibacter]|uniref:hypothetical protein n=1 Tax=unclassified Janibacter TaxID=2649294 RepID=UPI003D00DFFA
MNARHLTNRQLAAIVGAAAVVAGGVGAAATATAAPLASVQSAVDPDKNHTDYWVSYLEDMGYTDVECTKYDGLNDKTWTVPAGEWVLLVLKAGAGDDASVTVTNPVAGQAYDHPTGKDLSHVILCSGDKETSTTTSTTSTDTTTTSTDTTTTSTDTSTTDTSTTSTGTSTTTPVTTSTDVPSGPVVETDIPAKDSNTPWLLGGSLALLGGAALAGAGLRRQSAKH